jgi:hypothetical protein
MFKPKLLGIFHAPSSCRVVIGEAGEAGKSAQTTEGQSLEEARDRIRSEKGRCSELDNADAWNELEVTDVMRCDPVAKF